MEKKTKQNLLLVIVGVVLFAALTNLSAVIGFLGKVIGIIMPVIVGGILAMFINVPMTGIEKRLRRIFAKPKRSSPKSFFEAPHLYSRYYASCWYLHACLSCSCRSL